MIMTEYELYYNIPRIKVNPNGDRYQELKYTIPYYLKYRDQITNYPTTVVYKFDNEVITELDMMVKLSKIQSKYESKAT